MEGSQATQGTLTQATQPSDPGPLQSPKDSAELVVKLLKRKGAADAAITSIEIPKRGELVIGRKATVVDIAVQDQRCSARHIRIYQQSEFGIFIEQLGGNGSFLNSQQLKKGDVRTLQHGDEISVLNYGQSVPDAPAENQPFAVFVFRYAEPTRRSDSYEPRKRLKVEADEACDMMATLGGPGLAGDEGDIDATALSTEEAFQANYDMRIGIDTLIGKGTFSEVRRGVCVRDGQFRAIKVVNRNKFNSFQMLRGSGQESDPVEEVTVQLGNLEITLKVKQIGGRSSASSSAGFELVSAGGDSAAAGLPISASPTSEAAVATTSPSLEERAFLATGPASFAALPLDFLDHLKRRLSAADRSWVPAARIGGCRSAFAVVATAMWGSGFSRQFGGGLLCGLREKRWLHAMLQCRISSRSSFGRTRYGTRATGGASSLRSRGGYFPWTSAGQSKGYAYRHMTDVFSRGSGSRGSGAVVQFSVGGQSGRPMSQSVMLTADGWIAGNDMDATAAQDYVTGEEFSDDAEAEHLQTGGPGEGDIPYAELRRRVAELEAQVQSGAQEQPESAGPRVPILGGSKAPPPARQQSLFAPTDRQGGLDGATWKRLQDLAGPPPGRGATSKAPPVHPAHNHQESVYAEIEKEVEDPQDGSLALLPELIAGSGDPLQKMLAVQMQQNALLLQKVLGNRQSDPILGVLAGSSSSSGEGDPESKVVWLAKFSKSRFRTR
eukprot:symbB.v1.2.026787.t1/scaffold2527.1/size76866/1